MSVETRVNQRDPDLRQRRIEERLTKARQVFRDSSRTAAAKGEPSSPFLRRQRDERHAFFFKTNHQESAAAGLEAVKWHGKTPAEEPIPFTTDQLRRLGSLYLDAAERGSFEEFMVFLEEGFPVNYRDSRSLQTALHVAAGNGARPVIKALLATKQCDFLIRDRWGRLASELAYLYGEDIALARLLRKKERQQGMAQGVKVTRRPKPETDA